MPESEARARVAAEILALLSAAIPGGEARLRGSMASGEADFYSDIDLSWHVPDESFALAWRSLYELIASRFTVLSFRFDVDFQRSAGRRLAYVLIEGLPVFWRVDIDLRARSAASDPRYDESNPAARGDDWSLPESALMNAIAAAKALARGRPDAASTQLAVGLGKLGVEGCKSPSRHAIEALASEACRAEPRLATIAALLREALAIHVA